MFLRSPLGTRSRRSTALRWTRRLVQLYLGLVLYGVSAAMQVQAGLGLDPWDVLHQGLAVVTGHGSAPSASRSGRWCCCCGSRCASDRGSAR